MIYDVEFNSGAQYRVKDVVELAVLAERQGFAGTWQGESNSQDPIVLLSAIAVKTTSLQLGTAIYHVYGRSPVTLGIQAATLNDLSDGRLLLGLGVANARIASWHGATTFDKPIKRIREYAEIVRRVHSGEKVEYRGEAYSTTPFKLSWKPSHPDLAIYLAGLGPRMTRQAGTIARGVIVNMADPPQLRKIVANVRAGAEEAGRDPGSVEIVAKVRCALNRDLERAKAPLRNVLTFYSLADYYGNMIREMGWAEEIDAVHAAYREGGFRAATAAIPDRMLLGLPMVPATSVEEVRERVSEWGEAGATRINLSVVPCGQDLVEEVRTFLKAW